MDKREIDVAIIGAGSAGLNARREVEKAGGRALLIESGPYGTTCARVGCMPSKLLIAAADAAHEVASAPQFGIESANGWSVNSRKVLERVRRERDRFVRFVVENTEALPAAQRLMGHARFIGPTSLEVNGQTRIDANAVVIATGSSPVIPPPFDSIREKVLVSDDIFELENLPKSIAVIGTGIIGLEIGQALHRLGVRVTFFNPLDDLGPFTDPEIKKAVAEVLGGDLDLRLRSKVLSAQLKNGSVRLLIQDANGTRTEREFEAVFVAAGRQPNVMELNLDRAGIETGERGLPEWDPQTTQIGDRPLFMAGDVSGHIPLLHEASDEGRIAGANSMLYPNVSVHLRRTPLAIAFTDPQMAMVGKRHADLEPAQIEIGEVSFSDQGRARVMGRNQGLLRVYADKECCSIVGAELFGPQAEHLAHLLAWAVQQRMTVSRALQMPFYHPVLEEGLRSALRDLATKLRVTGDCRCEDFASAPGA